MTRADTTETGGTYLVSIGSLTRTSVVSITGQSNSEPIVITFTGPLFYATEDWVDILGCTPNTAANGHWKIKSIGTGSFSLMGSKGNGATSATGSFKKTNESDILVTGMDPGNAFYFVFSSSGAINRFELHGIRASMLFYPRGMNATTIRPRVAH